jgi:hypothetical protein
MRSGWLGGVVLACACGSSTVKPGDCAYVVATLDAGTDAFAGVGDRATDQTCQQFCPQGYPICILVSPTTVKCQEGCK